MRLESTMGTDLIPANVRSKFEVAERHHACAILKHDFPDEWRDLLSVLGDFCLPKSHIITPGGGKSPIATALNGSFYKRDWKKKVFKIRVQVDDVVTLAPTHEVDYFKNRIAIETEWNNKTAFYDRDLTTFRLLFDLNVLSVGVIITRADELQEIFDELGKGSSYGPSTTIFSKLIPKLDNRASGGCPVLAFGMTKRTYDPKH
jgi:restriction endonuclease BglII